jgi:hypothetical protein
MRMVLDHALALFDALCNRYVRLGAGVAGLLCAVYMQMADPRIDSGTELILLACSRFAYPIAITLFAASVWFTHRSFAAGLCAVLCVATLLAESSPMRFLRLEGWHYLVGVLAICSYLLWDFCKVFPLRDQNFK